MSDLVIDLIAESKTYVHDDHAAVQGWIDDSAWLRWLNTEWRQLYRRLCRNGLVDPAPAGETLTLPSDTITNAEAIIFVAEVTGLDQRILRPSQPTLGRMYLAQSGTPGTGATWAAQSGLTGGITVSLNPPPASGNYIAYYIPTPQKLVLTTPADSTETDTLYLPAGAADRLCLGAARRSLVRARGSSQQLKELIAETDAEISFAAAARLAQDGMRVRNVDWLVRGWRPRGQDMQQYYFDRTNWFWR